MLVNNEGHWLHINYQNNWLSSLFVQRQQGLVVWWSDGWVWLRSPFIWSKVRSFFSSNVDYSSYHTVARYMQVCCKSDDGSLRGRGNLTSAPSTLKPFNRSSRKFAQPIANFASDRLRRFVSAHTRLRTPFCLLGYFSGVLPLAPSQDARTDFNAKYVKRRGSAQGCSRSENRNLILRPPFPRKPPVFDSTVKGT